MEALEMLTNLQYAVDKASYIKHKLLLAQGIFASEIMLITVAVIKKKYPPKSN